MKRRKYRTGNQKWRDLEAENAEQNKRSREMKRRTETRQRIVHSLVMGDQTVKEISEREHVPEDDILRIQEWVKNRL